MNISVADQHVENGRGLKSETGDLEMENGGRGLKSETKTKEMENGGRGLKSKTKTDEIENGGRGLKSETKTDEMENDGRGLKSETKTDEMENGGRGLKSETKTDDKENDGRGLKSETKTDVMENGGRGLKSDTRAHKMENGGRGLKTETKTDEIENGGRGLKSDTRVHEMENGGRGLKTETKTDEMENGGRGLKSETKTDEMENGGRGLKAETKTDEIKNGGRGLKSESKTDEMENGGRGLKSETKTDEMENGGRGLKSETKPDEMENGGRGLKTETKTDEIENGGRGLKSDTRVHEMENGGRRLKSETKTDEMKNGGRGLKSETKTHDMENGGRGLKSETKTDEMENGGRGLKSETKTDEMENGGRGLKSETKSDKMENGGRGLKSETKTDGMENGGGGLKSETKTDEMQNGGRGLKSESKTDEMENGGRGLKTETKTDEMENGGRGLKSKTKAHEMQNGGRGLQSDIIDHVMKNGGRGLKSDTKAHKIENGRGLKSGTRAYTNKREQEENQSTETFNNQCAEGPEECSETSDDDNAIDYYNSTLITGAKNIADIADSEGLKIPPNEEGAVCIIKRVATSETTNATMIISNFEMGKFNSKWAVTSKESGITTTIIPSIDDRARRTNNRVEPAVQKSKINSVIIPSIADHARKNKKRVEPAVKKSEIINSVIIPSLAKCNKKSVVGTVEKSGVTNGAIIIPKQSEITMNVVIPAQTDFIHDTDHEENETLVNAIGEERGINMQSMNIALKEIEDSIDSDDKDNSAKKIKNNRENYSSKNPHSNKESNISNNEKISNCELSINELGDRLIKLDLTADDGLASAASNFQKMNICAEEVSDEENASDNESIPSDDQDTAFEGDDENDDDDFEPSFEKRTGFKLSEKVEKRINKQLAEQEKEEDEYISRNPIAQAKSNDRYLPYYTHPNHSSSEPIISADELIQNFTVSENEKNFLSSLPPNLNIESCLIDETQITNPQDSLCNGDKFRDIDELSMTSDLGRSVVADSPQSMPSPSDCYSDYENVDHLPDFSLLQNIPTPVTMLPMPSSNQNTKQTMILEQNHVSRKASVNENCDFTYPTTASNPTPDKNIPAQSSTAEANIIYNQLTVGFPNTEPMHRKKPVTSSIYSKHLNGGTVHVSVRRPTLIERNVNVPHQVPVQVALVQPLANTSIQPRSATRESPIQPRQQGPLLYLEQEMYRTAAERLQGRTGRKLYSPTDFEWIKLLVNKPGQSPETKNFFFDFLNGNNTTLMEERVLAHSNYIKCALKDPEFFLMRDPITGFTPLRLAAFNHNSKPLIARCIADYTVETSGKKLDYDVDEKGETVLHKLACIGETHVEVLAELLHVKMRDRSEAFDVNKPNIDGMTPLILAIVGNVRHSFLTVDQLIKHGARIEAEDKRGRNCLHYAVDKIEYNGGFEILRKLLQSLHSCVVNGKLDKAGRYAVINKCDDQGFSPLHLAIRDAHLPINEQLKVIQLLKDFGSDPKLKCCGHIPLLLVENSDRRDIIRPHLQKSGSILRPQAVKY